MKSLTVADALFSALEDVSARSGRPISDLVSEAIEAWLVDAAIDDAEQREIEAARIEAAEQGGVEFESFFSELLDERG